jgi:cysteine desulfurase/selenocysteine lyase
MTSTVPTPAGTPAPAGTAVGDRSLESIRAEFPILGRRIKGEPLSYLDNGATVQKPAAVIDAIGAFYREHNSNVHRGAHTLSAEATALYEGARTKVARLLGAASNEIVLTRNVTEAINVAAQGWGQDHLGPGDRIVLTEMEHHSNIVPWYLVARRTGAVLDWVGIDDEGRLDRESLTHALERGPKVVAVTHVSNVLGTVLPVAEIVAEAREAGALTLIDGAQAVPRLPVDVKQIDADFYAFTGHKLYGPTGIGVLYGRREVLDSMEPFEGGGSMISRVSKEEITWASVPTRFEPGTPPIAEAAGLGAAVDWVGGVGLEAIGDHERALTAYALPRLAEVPGLRIFGPSGLEDREGLISFEVAGIHPHDVSEILDRHGVAVRAGHHCAQPLMKRLGVAATTRASFAVYNDFTEVDRLVEGLHDARRVFGL